MKNYYIIIVLIAQFWSVAKSFFMESIERSKKKFGNVIFFVNCQLIFSMLYF